MPNEGSIKVDSGKSLSNHQVHSWHSQYSPGSRNKSPMDRMDVIAQVMLVIGVICTTVMGVTARGGDFIISALPLLLYLAFQTAGGHLSLSHKNIIRQILSSIKNTTARLDLDCKTVVYAVCSCHCMYTPMFTDGSTIPIYPEHCTHYPKPEAQCGEALLETNTTGKRQPKKTFRYHSFHNYLSNLLA